MKLELYTPARLMMSYLIIIEKKRQDQSLEPRFRIIYQRRVERILSRALRPDVLANIDWEEDQLLVHL